jgi:photosystem II stability/assembly factor-like uncharacterized protein
VLVGSGGGGVWESHDRGLTWQPRTDDQPALAIGAIAFSPSSPAIVYAGTGEGDFYSQLGVGLLRSTDGGASWTLRATGAFAGQGFYDIAVDPLDGNHVLAGTTNGLFESTDGGASWTPRRSRETWSVSIHPVTPGDPNSTLEVFAACTDGVFRSTNGGSTWTAVTLPAAPTSFNRLEVRHAASDGGVVFAFGAASAALLWRRSAFGGTFAVETPPVGMDIGQAWYDWYAATAPNNPDVLYLGAIAIYKGTRSTTGSWTWDNISARATGSSVHPDQHVIAFGPTDPNDVWVGNDGGVYHSTDGGGTWTSRNKGLCITEFEYLAQHPQFEAWLLAGTQDNGTLRYEGHEVWFHVQDGDGGDCGCSESTPYTCFHSFYSMGLERSTTGGSWGSWAYVGPPVASNYSSLFYPPMEVNGSVVAQAGATICLSRDAGTNWVQVALPASAGVASALAIPTADRVYAATEQGRIYRTDYAAGSWSAAAFVGQPRAGYTSDICVDPGNANRLWVTYSYISGSHVFRSDDGGATWVDVSGGLPTIPVNAIALDPANTDTAWIAADVGVYRTIDAGATWQSFSNQLPNALVKDLVFHAPSRLLRAATQSRGAWEIAVDDTAMSDVDVYLRDSVVDVGRTSPSPSGVADPFVFGATTYWWQCADIKVDSPTYQEPALSDVDFEEFSDDHGVFADGLIHENAQRSRRARVYVQVHNRGQNPAMNLAVKVFVADASVGLPDLPAAFWTNFPNNAIPATSPWQAIAAHAVVPLVEPGKAVVVGFEWDVPATAAGHSCLLTIITAQNDALVTTERNIAALVTGSSKCGLKNLTIVDPLPAIGPRVRALKLNLWGSAKGRRYVIGGDRRSGRIVAAVVLSKRLSKIARSSEIASVELSEDQVVELRKLLRRHPELAEQLDTRTAWAPPTDRRWIKPFELDRRVPEPVVLLVSSRARRGAWSIVQRNEEGEVVGGFTLQVNGPMDK